MRDSQNGALVLDYMKAILTDKEADGADFSDIKWHTTEKYFYYQLNGGAWEYFANEKQETLEKTSLYNAIDRYNEGENLIDTAVFIYPINQGSY